MKKKKFYTSATLLLGFIAVVTAVDLATPVRSFSELENRYLKTNAKFSFARLWSGDFQSRYEEVVTDQFVGRDSWITIKSEAESALLKTENNGVLYGKNGALFGKLTSYNQEQLEKNISFVNAFADIAGSVTFGIIPSGYTYSTDQLPTGAGQVDQQAVLTEIPTQLHDSVEWLDVDAFLTKMNDTDYDLGHNVPTDWYTQNAVHEALYYNTDHHWRGTTAYKFYIRYCLDRNYPYFAYGADMDSCTVGELQLREVSDFYGTYYSKCKKVNTELDTLTYFELPIEIKTVVDGEEKDGWYDASAFETRDKYAAFLYGNGGLTVLSKGNTTENSEEEGRRMLLIKDSYSNVLASLFLSAFDEVYVVDLRSYPSGLGTLIEEKNFDEILILYNFENIQSDTNFYRLLY